MKKLIAVTLIAGLLSACADSRTIEGRTYGTYGLFNQSDMRNDKIQYRVSVGNVLLSILLFETIVAPVYFLGFSLYEPVGKLGPSAKEKGEL